MCALSVEQIEQIAREITVQIVDTQNFTNSVSGLIIKQTGNTYTALTVQHVVKSGKKGITLSNKIRHLANLLLKVDLNQVSITSRREKYF
ncbi:hypothetical protein DSM106972_060180 [Dulcicalothrix desertica PCC 7102]|uniref:Uncharacterized protein n=1 Tax=Dulcicalothrix desertica PCC 7102 TaxID=232991 RepID=A0A433V8V7_9CYAN|nr:hypothetical protein DSM106972_060180 [Dulcicalothrix desertica PCC 7102]